jgi:hypothetical protein
MFVECRELKEIRLAPETKEIPAKAFMRCVKLEKINPDERRDINLPSGLETIRFSAFQDCSALRGELEIPPGVTAIESTAGGAGNGGAFYGCSGITRVVLPRSLDEDFIFTFRGCPIESFGLNGTGDLLKVSPEGKLLVRGDVAYWLAKTPGDITIPAGVRDYAKFAGNSDLTGVVFEEDPGLAFIPQNAFSGCANLVRVTLPGGVRAIYNYAFNGCSALEELTITNTSPTALTWPVDAMVFRHCAALKTIRVPQELVETYKADRNWKIKPSGVYGASYLSDLIIGADSN